jgi:CHAD domain-containing protein
MEASGRSAGSGGLRRVPLGVPQLGHGNSKLGKFRDEPQQRGLVLVAPGGREREQPGGGPQPVPGWRRPGDATEAATSRPGVAVSRLPQRPAAQNLGGDVQGVGGGTSRVSRHCRIGALVAVPGAEDRDAAIHEARKATKRARNAAEAAAPALGRPAAQAKELQQLLGDHHDSVVARTVLLSLAQHARAAGEDTFTYGLMHQRQACQAATLEQALPRFTAVTSGTASGSPAGGACGCLVLGSGTWRQAQGPPRLAGAVARHRAPVCIRLVGAARRRARRPGRWPRWNPTGTFLPRRPGTR